MRAARATSSTRAETGGPPPAAIEAWHLVGAPAEDGNPERLEQLRGGADVEQRFDPGGDDERGCADERAQVRRDIRPLAPAAVHPAEPACREELHTGGAADRERAADGRRAERARDECGREVARAHLRRVGVEALELGRDEPDDEPAVEHPHRGGHRPARARSLLGGEADLEAAPGREAVGDQGRLERHHRAPLAQRVRDLLAEPDHGIDPSRAQQRAAASRPSSTPPTR